MSEKATTSYRRNRVALLRKGHTIRSWALTHGYIPSTVYDALRGTRLGVKSLAIARDVKEFINA